MLVNRFSFLVFFTFIFNSVFSQNTDTCTVILGTDTLNICEMDQHIKNIPRNATRKLDSLVNYLTKVTDNDFEKTYIFYTYIGENMIYDLEKAKRIKHKKVKEILAPKDLITRKKGVCGDVAYLFQALCDKGGVTSRVVFGYSSGKRIKLNIKKKRMNHAWNAVFINGIWFHVDPTWGMKLYTDKKKNKKYVNYYYYLTEPEKFNKTHLPADPVYQLCDDPVNWSFFKWRNLSLRRHRYSRSFNYSDSLDQRLRLKPVDELIASANSSLNFIPQNKYTVIQLLNWPASDFTDKKKLDKTTIGLEDYYKARKMYTSIIKYCNSLDTKKAKKIAAFYTKKLNIAEREIIRLEKMEKLKRNPIFP
ncbi:MAG: hypothetical protein A2W91_08090 [Bacteroidetes bacterium GWF2_38_335]|nr:MAG: hypothetical protein A2W91_08090 [Bacteroidetes bacterium GWF2_38_335]OFY78995.1 MAG: hypothetical protein A2281_02630 [Bacteroidetes bacterium RIFOXYA12_FULL_38_20]HBS86067.1 hypothetical protein [Bacteroidales bacterium]